MTPIVPQPCASTRNVLRMHPIDTAPGRANIQRTRRPPGSEKTRY